MMRYHWSACPGSNQYCPTRDKAFLQFLLFFFSLSLPDKPSGPVLFCTGGDVSAESVLVRRDWVALVVYNTPYHEIHYVGLEDFWKQISDF